MSLVKDDTKRPGAGVSNDVDVVSEKASSTHNSEAISQGDEALKLVGAHRTTVYSDEYNNKLRRKIVCLVPCSPFSRSLLIIMAGSLGSPAVCRGLLLSIHVRSS
jgi:hypothetical protein